MEVLNKYYNLDEPTAYSSLDPIKKSLGNKYNKNKIREILSKEVVYSLYRPKKYKFKRLRNIPTGYWHQTHADLADLQSIAKENDGYKYILIIVDVLSRQVQAVPVRSKHSENMKSAFDELFKKIPKIESLWTDRGLEFISKPMLEYFKSKEIQKIQSKDSSVKAALAERYILTLKKRLFAYFAAQNTKHWTSVLDKFTNAINNSVNRTLGRTPASINKKNWFQIWKKHYSSSLTNDIKGSTFYRVGDFVRIILKKGVFEKSYLSNYTDELYQISKIIKSNPITFRLIDGNNEEVDRRFYKEELSLSHPETLFRVEKILKTRKRKGVTEHFVKWVNHSAKHNSWIQE